MADYLTTETQSRVGDSRPEGTPGCAAHPGQIAQCAPVTLGSRNPGPAPRVSLLRGGEPMTRIVHEQGCTRVAPSLPFPNRPALGAHRQARQPDGAA